MSVVRGAIAALLIALGASTRANDVPQRYPRLDLKQATSAIVVARVTRGEALPAPECDHAYCLFWPNWFHVQVRDVVSGSVPGRDLNVATLMHESHGLFEGVPQKLVFLKSVHDQVVMPLYAWKGLAERRDGELFLIDFGAGRTFFAPTWLPCGMTQLLEPIDEVAFDPALGITRDPGTGEFEEFTERGGGADPAAWNIDGEHAFPRAGVSVTRLRALIRGLAARHEPTDCPRPDAD